MEQEVHLRSIYEFRDETRWSKLYALLCERPDYVNISHKAVPTYTDHISFVEGKPYTAWYFITDVEDTIYGTIYLTDRSEVGIQVFEHYQRMGVGDRALELFLGLHPGPIYANIAPTNPRSMAFFSKHGFKPLQNTYVLEG